MRLRVTPRDNDRRQDPRTAVIEFECGSLATCGAGTRTFPSLYAPPARVAVEVLDDETAGAVVLESGGGTLVVFGGATDDYFIRLQLPADGAASQIAILTDGLTDVKTINGDPFTYQAIGGYHATQLFIGGVTLGNDGSGRITITRADVGSFLDEGFRPASSSASPAPAPPNGDRYVHAVDRVDDHADRDAASRAASFTGVVISKLVREGLWEGEVTFVTPGPPSTARPRRPAAARSSAPTAPGWLADGFLEGQRVRVCDDRHRRPAPTSRSRCCAATNATKDEKMQFTCRGRVPVQRHRRTSPSRGIAAVVTFTGNAADANAWYKQQRIELVADTPYTLPPGRDNVKVFPVSTHLLSKLRGPLAVEGGTTAADRSLRNGIKLAGRDGRGRSSRSRPQAPESSQIDVLNVFNDSSQADGVGTMTSTTLTGFGMSTGLTFGAARRSASRRRSRAGSASARSRSSDGQFTTDGAKSTIEVLNVLLGQGNDRLTITGTLDPATESYTPVTFTGALDIAPRRRRHLVHADPPRRHELGDRRGERLRRRPAGADLRRRRRWRVVRVAGSVLTLERGAGAPALADAANVVQTVSVPGPHGGLTVVHGGGNSPLADRRSGRRRVEQPDAPRRALVARRRLPGRPADLDRRLAGDVADHRLRRRHLHARRPVRALRQGRTMLLSGAALTRGHGRRRGTSPSSTPKKVTATGIDDPRRDQRHARTTGSWIPRLQRRDGGLDLRACPARGRSPRSSRTTLGLAGAPIVPTGLATRTVFGYDPALAGPVRMGGDELHVGTYVTGAMTSPRSTLTPQDGKTWARGLRGRPAGGHPRRRRGLHGRGRQRAPC